MFPPGRQSQTNRDDTAPGPEAEAEPFYRRLLDSTRQADLAAKRSSLTADDSLDIPDPIGQSPEVFAEIGSQIAHLLPPILEVCQNE